MSYFYCVVAIFAAFYITHRSKSKGGNMGKRKPSSHSHRRSGSGEVGKLQKKKKKIGYFIGLPRDSVVGISLAISSSIQTRNELTDPNKQQIHSLSDFGLQLVLHGTGSQEGEVQDLLVYHSTDPVKKQDEVTAVSWPHVPAHAEDMKNLYLLIQVQAGVELNISNAPKLHKRGKEGGTWWWVYSLLDILPPESDNGFVKVTNGEGHSCLLRFVAQASQLSPGTSSVSMFTCRKRSA
jgi:hypothetical protein